MARTRLTRVALESGDPGVARTRLTDISFVAGSGSAAPGAARTRLTDLSLVTSAPVSGVGITRITGIAFQTGPVYQPFAPLPFAYYLDVDGSFRPYRLLSLDDFPWT